MHRNVHSQKPLVRTFTTDILKKLTMKTAMLYLVSYQPQPISLFVVYMLANICYVYCAMLDIYFLCLSRSHSHSNFA
jgi:hypothetical protein